MSYQQVTLGVIIPDDGPFDYEWLHLDEWLTNHGLAHLNLYVERSKSDGDLTPEGLFKTGNIEEIYSSIAKYYEDDFDNAVAALSKTIEPIMIVFMGVIIGVLLLALYSPIFNVGSIIGG